MVTQQRRSCRDLDLKEETAMNGHRRNTKRLVAYALAILLLSGLLALFHGGSSTFMREMIQGRPLSTRNSVA
jgi:hypothetical protein